MKIKAHSKEYEVNLEQDFHFIEELKKEKNTLFIIDGNVYQLYQEQLFQDIQEESLFLIEATEEHKTIDTALEICDRMTRIPAKRNAQIISIGGGIIQDITGFAANVLYRGIRWIFVPTTLLAACDSCIGGKTSLNYKKYKNLLGTFYPPDRIYICSQFFSTLTEKDFLSGLGEVVKFNIMAGADGLEKVEKDIDLLIGRRHDILDDYVETSLYFKKKFIEEDEYDKGVRVLLNFAHTFGHAFETVTEYGIPHGTAVAMGTLTANYISEKRGYISGELRHRIEIVVAKIIKVPTQYMSLLTDMTALLDAVRKDKKQTDSQLTAVLIKDEKMELQVYHDLQKEEIVAAIENLLQIVTG